MMYRLLPDYECSPIWAGDGSDYRNLAPSEVSVSIGLQKALRDWAARYEQTYNRTDPLSSGFKSADDEQSFDKDGYQLWNRLKDELGSEHKVDYYSVVSGWKTA